MLGQNFKTDKIESKKITHPIQRIGLTFFLHNTNCVKEIRQKRTGMLSRKPNMKPDHGRDPDVGWSMKSEPVDVLSPEV